MRLTRGGRTGTHRMMQIVILLSLLSAASLSFARRTPRYGVSLYGDPEEEAWQGWLKVEAYYEDDACTGRLVMQNVFKASDDEVRDNMIPKLTSGGLSSLLCKTGERVGLFRKVPSSSLPCIVQYAPRNDGDRCPKSTQYHKWSVSTFFLPGVCFYRIAPTPGDAGFPGYIYSECKSNTDWTQSQCKGSNRPPTVIFEAASAVCDKCSSVANKKAEKLFVRAKPSDC